MKKEDRRIQKTKAAISAALFDLLEEKDFDQISINDIADRANVNRGTIYFHYADKSDLLDKIIEDRLEDLRAVCSPIHWDSTEKELKHYFTAVYQFFEDNYRFFSVMTKRGGTSRFQDRFKQLILQEMTRIPVASTKDSNEIFFLQFRVSALVGVVEWWIKEDHSLSVKEMADNTVILFIRNK